MTNLEQRLKNLSPQQREIVLNKLRRQKQPIAAESKGQAPTIVRVPRDRPIPLSFPQQQLWFLSHMHPQEPVYNETVVIYMHESINAVVLERSLTEIIRRHEILRTTFTVEDGQPIQVIHPPCPFTLPVVDLREIIEIDREAEARRLATEELKQPFDLRRGPLLRATLMQLDDQEYRLFLAFHHIILDGVSIYNIFLPELEKIYTAFLQGKPSPLTDLKIQYADFATWQRQWLQGKVLLPHLEYWKQKLSDLPTLQLPTDRPRTSQASFRGTRQYLKLPKELTEKLKALSNQEGVTLFMTLATAVNILLYRYSDQEDIVIGTVMAERNRPELERVMGHLLNTVVLRTDLSGNPNFLKLLLRLRQVTLEAYAHQEMPFEQLVAILQPERQISHNPLFQVGFVLEPPLAEENLNWSLSQLDIHSGAAKFDLTFELDERSEGIIGRLEYNTDLFDDDTIARMIEHFQTLLEGIVANPEQSISELPLLTEAESHQLLVEWNDTQADYPQDQCIHQLFEAQVEQTPEAEAVVLADQQLTYQQLNRRANQLAHHLQELGVGPEVPVGICVERSLEMIVGLLGILKAGGAYVPLDPTYPQERLVYMLNDSQVSVLLTQKQLVAGLPSCETKVICLDTDWATISQESEENPLSGVNPKNSAYVIYTSGSTGRPKGVLVGHQGLCNLAQAQKQTFELHSDSCVLQFASLSFDASIWEVVMALCSGAKLCLGTPNSLLPGPDLLQLLRDQAITHVTLPPSALAALPTEELPALETLIVAGEACSPNLVSKWSQGRRFFNAYGPTESTVCATIAECLDSGSPPPIGRPIANTQVYILDQHLQPVPIGVPGELYIGGIGLARGYLNRPDLTAKAFIANPFSDEPGARLYKTGDLVRYLPDCNIEFLGRLDYQVQIRGFRVELEEIEAVLSQHPDVLQAAVIFREDYPGEKRLVAYVVPRQEPAPTVRKVRHFLREKLPDYMVPSAFVMLDALPLMPNGKIDHRALPAPDISRMALEVGFVPPRTSTEKVLAVIWAEVLRLEQVGIHDNFFELGGDSILSIQIVARANKTGLQLTPKQLFEHQTIAELATVAGTVPSIQADQGLVRGRVPLTPIQHWFFEQNLPEPHHFNQSLLLEVSPELKPELLKQVVQHLLAHHDGLCLRFMASDGCWQQVNTTPDEIVPFSWHDLSKLSSEEQQKFIETTAAELQASLNLSEGPLMRSVLFNLGLNQPARLLLIIHHLAVDGVSWRILLEDLATAYQQLDRGETIQLPPKTTSFKHWAEKLTEYAQSEALAAQLDYWLAEPFSLSTPLPVDYSAGREANTVASAAQVSIFLSEEQTRALLQEVPQVYNTQINDVLLTALVQSFAQWTGEPSGLVDLEGHGREELFEEVDLSRTVGWFTSIFPVRLELKKADQPGEALKSIKEQLRSVPNRGIGYGIMRYLSQDTGMRLKLEALPQPEVSFNYLGQFDQMLSTAPILGIAKESMGSTCSLLGCRPYLLEVKGLVTSDRLQLDWTYSQKIHQRDTVKRLAQTFLEALQILIDHCLSTEAGGYTPSDFSAARLSQEQLDKLMTQIKQTDRR